MPQLFTIRAEWDAEAKVWWATSPDLPGFTTEAPSFEALAIRVHAILPELAGLRDGAEVLIEGAQTTLLPAAA